MAGEQQTPTIEVSGLSRFFGRTAALEQISFSAAPGEALFFVGGNGAGKSTLLSLLAGALAPTEGEIRLFGKAERKRSKTARAAVGYAGALPFLYRDFTIEESLTFFAEAYLRSGVKARVEEVISEFDLDSNRGKRARECSQGVVRRAALARSVLHSPKLLILDEPLTNLDAAAKTRLIELLGKEKGKGVTLVIASHEDDFVRAMADRVHVLRSGRMARTIEHSDLSTYSSTESTER